MTLDRRAFADLVALDAHARRSRCARHTFANASACASVQPCDPRPCAPSVVRRLDGDEPAARPQDAPDFAAPRRRCPASGARSRSTTRSTRPRRARESTRRCLRRTARRRDRARSRATRSITGAGSTPVTVAPRLRRVARRDARTAAEVDDGGARARDPLSRATSCASSLRPNDMLSAATSPDGPANCRSGRGGWERWCWSCDDLDS